VGGRKKRELALFSFALGAFVFFALFFVRAFALFFASRSLARKRKQSACAHLWKENIHLKQAESERV
jgi:hypothetical protein